MFSDPFGFYPERPQHYLSQPRAAYPSTHRYDGSPFYYANPYDRRQQYVQPMFTTRDPYENYYKEQEEDPEEYEYDPRRMQSRPAVKPFQQQAQGGKKGKKNNSTNKKSGGDKPKVKVPSPSSIPTAAPAPVPVPAASPVESKPDSSKRNFEKKKKDSPSACFVGSRSVLQTQTEECLIEEVDPSSVATETPAPSPPKTQFCYYDDDDSEVEDVFYEGLSFSSALSSSGANSLTSSPHIMDVAEHVDSSMEPVAEAQPADLEAWYERDLELLAALGFTDRAELLPLLREHVGEGVQSVPARQRGLQQVMAKLLLNR